MVAVEAEQAGRFKAGYLVKVEHYLVGRAMNESKKLGRHQKCLLELLHNDPLYVGCLWDSPTIRRAEALIRKGYIDNQCRVTEAGIAALNAANQPQRER